MKYLGLDWGLKRIGAAVSEGELASPLTTLEVNSLADAVEKVRKLVVKEAVEEVVIGQPEGLSGKMVEKAVVKLQQLGLKVTLTDETLSTQQAQAQLRQTGVGKKGRRQDDALSAAIILQQYLDEKT